MFILLQFPIIPHCRPGIRLLSPRKTFGERASISYLAGRSVGCPGAPLWHLVHLLGALLGGGERRRALGHPGLLLVSGARGRGLGGRRLGLKHGPNQQLEAVAGGDALPAVQGAEPPALQAASVLLDDREDVAFPEGQFFRGLRDIVVQGLGHQVLEQVETMSQRVTDNSLSQCVTENSLSQCVTVLSQSDISYCVSDLSQSAADLSHQSASGKPQRSGV